MIIHTEQKALKLSDKLDPEAMLYYTLYLKPPVWLAGVEYTECAIVSPSSPTGFYYIVTSGGVTGTSEPTWGSIAGSITQSGTVDFTAANNNAYLLSSGSLITGSAVFTASDGVPITNSLFTSDGKAEVQVGPVPSGVSKFTLKLTFYADVGKASTVLDERSVVITVKDR